jgi:hypothetical protein
MRDALSAQALAELVEFGEAEAYADLFRAAPSDLGLRVERIGTAVALLAPRFPIILLNRVIGLGVREPASLATLETLLALYQQAGIHTFALQVSPATQPPELVDWLQARHLHPRDNWAKVYRRPDTDIMVPTDLRIERIGPRDAAHFARVASTAFGMPDSLRPWLEQSVGRPGWRHYLAFDGELPVATGALFMQGATGWLGAGSTLPSHRRRGAQGALMAQRIRDAAGDGCVWVVTETGEDLPHQPNPSFHNMLRTGFVLAYRRPNYIR